MAPCLYCTKATGISILTTKFLFYNYLAFNVFQNISEPSKTLTHGICIVLARCLGGKNNQFNLQPVLQLIQ